MKDQELLRGPQQPTQRSQTKQNYPKAKDVKALEKRRQGQSSGKAKAAAKQSKGRSEARATAEQKQIRSQKQRQRPRQWQAKCNGRAEHGQKARRIVILIRYL